MSAKHLWERYQQYLCVCPEIHMSFDISRMHFPDNYFETMKAVADKAVKHAHDVVSGTVANPDEKRMVGHYWLRDPELAPNPELRDAIRNTVDRIEAFAAKVHDGSIANEKQAKFTDILLIGIGGSALGPQWIADALTQPGKDAMRIHFFDNTDPEGMHRVLREIGNNLQTALAVVISKSGSTPETANGMLYAKKAFEQAGLNFASHAVAVTGEGSKLYNIAKNDGWIDIFPMWDWVGGRTSELSAVGLLPAALQGFDIRAMLAGAKACDAYTLSNDIKNNPAMLMALMWHFAGEGKGKKDLVVLCYKDRLLLFSRYLQQLIMESLGKEKDLDGNIVHQGLSVYGNKGSTDQHAYVQQLREGIPNHFVTFVDVLEAGADDIQIDPGVTTVDFLHGFLQGTRKALYENGRQSMTITIPRVDAFHLGVLIALFERAVTLYASMININAYHQPGVEAGKKAAASVLSLQQNILDCLKNADSELDAEAIAAKLSREDDVEIIAKLLEYLFANQRIRSKDNDIFNYKRKFFL